MISEAAAALGKLLGEALMPKDARWDVDGIAPTWVATPPSVEQLTAALAAADEHTAAVIPWGGGTHMSLGNIPKRYDLALSTARLDRVIEYEPADMTVTVEAGMTMGALQSLLTEHRQFLPIDAPAEATVGGVLAAGMSGPSAHAYGLPRDWLIGCKLALAGGTIVKGGGRVVKNVAGYDLPKLVVGSLGTLGVIVEATFKLAPWPAAQETLLATFESLEDASGAVFAADARGLALRAAVVLVEPAARARAAFWVAGAASAVGRTARELAELTRGVEARRLEGEESERWWAELDTRSGKRDGGRPPRAEVRYVRFRASLPPSRVIGFMDVMARMVSETLMVAYPTNGAVRVEMAAEDVEEVVLIVERARTAAVEAGGSLVMTEGRVEVKQRVDVWGGVGESIAVMRRLKEEFDPKSTLSPGRYVGGI